MIGPVTVTSAGTAVVVVVSVDRSEASSPSVQAPRSAAAQIARAAVARRVVRTERTRHVRVEAVRAPGVVFVIPCSPWTSSAEAGNRTLCLAGDTELRRAEGARSARRQVVVEQTEGA